MTFMKLLENHVLARKKSTLPHNSYSHFPGFTFSWC